MSSARALKRLLTLREHEEGQRRRALECAVAELHRLLDARQTNLENERRCRGLIRASADSGELADRLAGLQELTHVQKMETILSRHIALAETRVAELQSSYRQSQIERRQAEIILTGFKEKDRTEAARRLQQGLDEWHRSRNRRI